MNKYATPEAIEAITCHLGSGSEVKGMLIGADWVYVDRAARQCILALRNKVTELEARLTAPRPDKFSVFDGCGHAEFHTIEDANRFADESLSDFRTDAGREGEWSTEVECVSVWVKVAQVVATEETEEHTEYAVRELPV